MTSWRDDTSQQAQEDFDRLVNAVLRFGTRMIARSGEIHPFGAAVTRDGQLKMLALDPSEGAGLASADVLRNLYAGMRQSRDEHRAVAFAADGVARASKAVRVELEHQEGAALVLVVPYTRTRWRKRVMLGPMLAGGAERRIWTG